ncbi:MAG: 4Fe-4S binding protein [Thermoanaerobacteraceae bacterium]|nr:4Fe-4S binding protein [Thermoanaerobacteraceae bacterium]
MKTHLWCRSDLCTACHDCETACVFIRNTDWKSPNDVVVNDADKDKVNTLLCQKATDEQAKAYVAIREMIKNKKKTPTVPLLYIIEKENNNYALTCRHCEDAKCVKVCPTKAIRISSEGVILSPDQNKCIGCGLCSIACPFGIPNFQANGKMIKCDLCIDRLREGKEPACVAVCNEKALVFKDLKTIYAPKPQGNQEVGYGIRELWHNINKNPEYMLRFRGIGGGYFTSEQLDVICKWADKIVKNKNYKNGYVDISLRQAIELHHLKFSNEVEKEEFFNDLKKVGLSMGNFGPLFRNIVSCIGSCCYKSRGDAKRLGHNLYKRINDIGFNLPVLKGKIKVGISGCLEGCGHMRMYDITVGILRDGDIEGKIIEKVLPGDEKKPTIYRVFLGGNMGRFPQPGIKVADMTNEHEIIDFIVKIAEFFKDHCELGNIHRLSYWIRVRYGKTGDPFIFSIEGIESFLKDFTAWVEKKYGRLSWLSNISIEDPIPDFVFKFIDYHKNKLTPIDIYKREEVFPHLKGVE